MLAEKARAAAVSQATVYIEDVFSTYLYTGTGSSQTITNNIDLSGNGGLTWIKSRSAATGHRLTDTVRGATKSISSDSNAAEATESTGLTAFGTTGFTIGADTDYNTNAATYVSWTLREQPKFFDIVTYTGTGSATTIAHSLGVVPGCIMVRGTSAGTAGTSWRVYHRSLTSAAYTLVLNGSAAQQSEPSAWNSTAPTSTVFTVGTEISVNNLGDTYVAYLFAHDAGGFGLAGTDNVVSCGSFTTDGSGNATVTLGYEPQWVIVKQTDAIGNWYMFDTMREWSLSTEALLYANLTDAEIAGATGGNPTATGFSIANFNASGAFVYIAIRRGPMKVPTTATSVFGLNARSGTGTNATVTGSAGVSDVALIKNRGSAVGGLFAARLTGTSYLETSSTAAQVAAGTTILQANPWDVMDGVKVGTTSTITNASSNTFINYLFDRAPGFLDVVCYTGTGANTTQAHNLKVVPELMIVKGRSGATAWQVYSSGLANTEYLVLDTTAAKATGATRWNSTTPTSSVFSLGTASEVNTSTETYVAYLFATVAGVSKVGSYTGTATTLQVNCDFAAGARFVMIKRTDSTGDWYFWDSTRGIIAGNDPYLLMNSTAAEVTGTDYVDTYSAGFEISSTAPAAINASGGTFIFLAIA